MTKTNNLYLDFGNSRLKLFYNDSYYSFKNSVDFETIIMPQLNIVPEKTKVIYSSVNLEKITSFIQSNEFKNYVSFDSMIKKQTLIDYSGISGIGNDRLLGLYSVAHSRKTPSIIIDFGTAITINIIDKDNRVLGGFILPGLNTGFKALNEFTSGLPKVEMNVNYKIGQNTKEAISIGTTFALIHGINELITKIYSENFANKQIAVFVTGGNSKSIYDLLLSEFNKKESYHQLNFQFDEHLVLKGLVKLFHDTNL